MPDEPATPQTQWFTGSTTKAFTAAALAQVVQDSDHFANITWSTSLAELLRDEFVLTDDHDTLHINLLDALSHRTGMPRHDFSYGFEGETSESIIRRLRYLPVTNELRADWEYCNLMYIAAGRCLEVLLDEDLASILESKLWRPMGMLSTTFNLSAATNPSKGPSRLARGYFWDPATRQYVTEPYINLYPVAGAGATISTVEDYALWIKTLLSAASGTKNESSPLSPKMFHDLVTPRSIINSLTSPGDSNAYITPPLYGLGWLSTKVLGQVLVTHGGGLTGFGTEVYIVPSRNIGIVMMANTMETSNLAQSIIASRLLDEMLMGSDDVSTTEGEDSLQAVLQNTAEAHLPRWLRGAESRERMASEPESITLWSAASEKERLPFPGNAQTLASIAGIYSHPGYGSFNLTAAPSSSSISNFTFQTYLYPRTWPLKLVLTHVSHTTFRLHMYFLHGLNDTSLTGGGSGTLDLDNAVLEDLDGKQFASFELDLLGDRVARVGMELEESMVEAAARRSRGKGRGELWREGMIWFEKV